jgi:hypothetical protein
VHQILAGLDFDLHIWHCCEFVCYAGLAALLGSLFLFAVLLLIAVETDLNPMLRKCL